MNQTTEVMTIEPDGRLSRQGIGQNCLGTEIDRLAIGEKVLTDEQADLVKANFEGHPQIIRGVAGSGKTIVLAHNLARRLARYSQTLFPEGLESPQPRIGVVCFNRSLVPFIQKKTREAYKTRPHGPNLNCSIDFNHFNGFIFHLTTHPKAKSEGFGGPLTYQHVDEQDDQDAKNRAESYLEEVEKLKQADCLEQFLFDTIYLDEGQDLEEEEYRLLLELLRPSPKTGERNLIVFYDDAQNVYARPRPKWTNLGLDVVRGRRSRSLKECHRNTRTIVEFAFNVLVGKQADDSTRGIREFADTETLKRNNQISETDTLIKIHFAKREGPAPVIKFFKDSSAEANWVAEEVSRLMSDEKVRPEDILILFEGQNGIQDQISAIRSKCKSTIGFSQPHLKPEKDEYAIRPGQVTVTTTKSIKGYDAYVVFVVGTDRFPMTHQGRASFYVGCTRARLRLYVSGMEGKGTLLAEAMRVSQIMTKPVC